MGGSAANNSQSFRPYNQRFDDSIQRNKVHVPNYSLNVYDVRISLPFNISEQ